MLVAQGGMGQVYRATDSALERTVAVKLLSDRYAGDEDARARFRREALAAARLSTTPNVVMVFDVAEHRGRPLIVMEYLEGGSVYERLRDGRVSREQALTWLEQAAAALDQAHASGIVHRDVKPANLLLDGDEQRPRLRLRDRVGEWLGHAHVAGNGARHRRLPRSGAGSRRARHGCERPLRARCRRLRAPHRTPPVRRGTRRRRKRSAICTPRSRARPRSIPRCLRASTTSSESRSRRSPRRGRRTPSPSCRCCARRSPRRQPAAAPAPTLVYAAEPAPVSSAAPGAASGLSHETPARPARRGCGSGAAARPRVPRCRARPLGRRLPLRRVARSDALRGHDDEQRFDEPGELDDARRSGAQRTWLRPDAGGRLPRCASAPPAGRPRVEGVGDADGGVRELQPRLLPVRRRSLRRRHRAARSVAANPGLTPGDRRSPCALAGAVRRGRAAKAGRRGARQARSRQGQRPRRLRGRGYDAVGSRRPTISPSSGKRPVACFEKRRSPSTSTSNCERAPGMAVASAPTASLSSAARLAARAS